MSDGASLLRSAAPTQNPFHQFQPIPLPPEARAPTLHSSEDELEPREMPSRRSKRSTASGSNRARTRPVPSPSSTRSPRSPRIKTRQVGSPPRQHSADPFALSDFSWDTSQTNSPQQTTPQKPTHPNKTREEDFLHWDDFAGSSTSPASRAPPPRTSSNPFENLMDPFQESTFGSSSNVLEPPVAGDSAASRQPPRSRRFKRRHTAPVGTIESAVEKLRAVNAKESGGVAGSTGSTVMEGDESNSDDDLDEPVVSPKKAAQEKKEKKEKTRRNSEPAPKVHDCIDELHRGTALLKYGRRGYPHFRQFQLSADNTRLQWFSKKKGIAESAIDLSDINEVRTGQTTPEFERVGWTSLSPASFSIVYANRTRRLSLVAKSVDEQKMWVEALRHLRDKARKGRNMEEVDAVLVHVDYRDRNRPQSRRHSGKFVRGHETSERNVDNLLHKKLISDVSLLKERFRTVATQSNHPTIVASSENESIRQILSELEERLEELEHEVRQTRDTKIAENDVWRTKVDLEALEDKIQVLIKPKRRWSIKRT